MGIISSRDDYYIKKNNLWEENVIECWLYDLCDYALKQDVGLTYKTIRVLEDHWGFDTDKDDYQEKIIKEKITGIGIFNSKANEAYYINFKNDKELQEFKAIFESKEISKIGIDLGRIYILLKQEEMRKVFQQENLLKKLVRSS